MFLIVSNEGHMKSHSCVSKCSSPDGQQMRVPGVFRDRSPTPQYYIYKNDSFSSLVPKIISDDLCCLLSRFSSCGDWQ